MLQQLDQIRQTDPARWQVLLEPMERQAYMQGDHVLAWLIRLALDGTPASHGVEYDKGYSAGYRDGHREGYAEGAADVEDDYERGYADGQAAAKEC